MSPHDRRLNVLCFCCANGYIFTLGGGKKKEPTIDGEGHLGVKHGNIFSHVN